MPIFWQYDVYVYFDGANENQWRTANYGMVGGASRNGVEDSENTNWGTGQNTSEVYQLPYTNGNKPWPQTTQTKLWRWIKRDGY